MSEKMNCATRRKYFASLKNSLKSIELVIYHVSLISPNISRRNFLLRLSSPEDVKVITDHYKKIQQQN